MRRSFGVPVNFSQCSGFLHDGGGKVGVVMMPAWGLEEFTIRRGWGGFADLLADAGYCCLRFDWPGSGDSLGDGKDIDRLDLWKDAALAASTLLRSVAGIEKIVLVGHGIGGLLAPHLAQMLAADALVQMGPQSEGRTGMRELDALSKMIASFLRMPLETDENSINVAGHLISKALAEDIAGLRTTTITGGSAIPALTVLRSGTRGAMEWPQKLSAAGFRVTEVDYAGYDAFIAHNRASITPIEDFERVRDWLLETVPPGTPQRQQTSLIANGLEGNDFRERPVLFGEENKLFGVLCIPTSVAPRAVVVFINSGDTYHIGWGRMHVEFARALAGEGIASFRIDTSGLGDSGTSGGAPFFTETQIKDVLKAVSVANAENLGPILVYGLCSGGYASIQAAARDQRVQAVVAVNPSRLAIAEDETFDQILSRGTSSLADYRRRALSMGIVKDIISGRIAISAVIRKGRQMANAYAETIYQRIFGYSRLSVAAQRQAKDLLARGVTSIFIFAENDAGLDELARHFGNRKPHEYDHATVRLVNNAEHNMTARHARMAVLQGIRDAASTVISRKK